MIDDPLRLPESVAPSAPAPLPETPERTKSALREWIETILWAGSIALLLRFFIVQAFTIPSGSMEDTLLIGDFLLAEKVSQYFREPVPRDIVIFAHPSPPDGVRRDLIKRCVAKAGQTVEVRNKELYVDGVYIPLPKEGKHIDAMYREERDRFGPITVPPHSIFVMGDNRDNSEDSRFWGFLDLNYVKARPMILYWSWGQDPQSPRLNPNPASWIKSFVYNLTHFFQRVRWERVGRIIR